MELFDLLREGPSLVCVCWAAEHEVLHRFFFISAHWASSTVHPFLSFEVLVYWRVSEPELCYLACVDAAEFFVADHFEELSGRR